jgi:flagellar motility protein MotE (MotC chaperone)
MNQSYGDHFKKIRENQRSSSSDVVSSKKRASFKDSESSLRGSQRSKKNSQISKKDLSSRAAFSFKWIALSSLGFLVCCALLLFNEDSFFEEKRLERFLENPSEQSLSNSLSSDSGTLLQKNSEHSGEQNLEKSFWSSWDFLSGSEFPDFSFFPKLTIGFFSKAKAQKVSESATQNSPSSASESATISDATTISTSSKSRIASDTSNFSEDPSMKASEKDSQDMPSEDLGEKTLERVSMASLERDPEEEKHLLNLVKRSQELDLREQELLNLEKEIEEKNQKVLAKIAHLEKMRQDMESKLKFQVDEDNKKVDQLVEVYSAMKPTQAAIVLENLDEDLAVKVLTRMKKKNAAEVLNVMKTEKAKKFTELFTGFYRSPASGVQNTK